jgi:secreted PhoX family phosphatase
MKKSKISSKLSRRKFLTGLGLAAGAAAVAGPVLKTVNSAQGRSDRKLTIAKRRATAKSNLIAKFTGLEPLKMISRVAGTSRLPLAVRPV